MLTTCTLSALNRSRGPMVNTFRTGSVSSIRRTRRGTRLAVIKETALASFAKRSIRKSALMTHVGERGGSEPGTVSLMDKRMGCAKSL